MSEAGPQTFESGGARVGSGGWVVGFPYPSHPNLRCRVQPLLQGAVLVVPVCSTVAHEVCANRAQGSLSPCRRSSWQTSRWLGRIFGTCSKPRQNTLGNKWPVGNHVGACRLSSSSNFCPGVLVDAQLFPLTSDWCRFPTSCGSALVAQPEIP